MRRRQFHVRTIRNPGGSVSFQVSGMLRGRQVRRQFCSKQDADECLADLKVQAAKAPDQEPRLTRLTNQEIADAEAAKIMLKQKYPDRDITLIDAVRFFIERYWIPVSDHTVATAAELYLKVKTTEVSSSQLRSVKGLLKRLSKDFPVQKLHEITPDVFHKWFETTFGDLKPKSWNNARGDLGTFFSWCMNKPRRWIPESPLDGIPIKNVTVGTPQIISVATAVELMAEVEKIEDGRFALPYAMMLFLGIRPDIDDGEIYRIGQVIAGELNKDWFHINDDQVHLSGQLTKTGGPRWITLPPNFPEWIKAYPLRSENFNLQRLSEHRAKLRDRFKIPHDGLRHSFCSYYARRYGPGAAALAAGHSEAMQRRRYLNAGISEAEAAAFFSIRPNGRRP